MMAIPSHRYGPIPRGSLHRITNKYTLKGFGHICLSVDDLDEACKFMESKGVAWKKKLTEGRMKNLAFVLDPDGYWIEIIQNERIKRSANW
jgi:lactoylglutathione lyase